MNTPRCANYNCHWLDQCKHGHWQYGDETRLPALSQRTPHTTHCFDFECGHYAKRGVACADCNEPIFKPVSIKHQR